MALKDLTHRPLLYRLKKALFDVILPKDLKFRQPCLKHQSNVHVESEPAWFRDHDCLRFAEEQLLTLGRKAKDPIQLMLKDRTSNFSKRCKKLPAISKRNFSHHTFASSLARTSSSSGRSRMLFPLAHFSEDLCPDFYGMSSAFLNFKPSTPNSAGELPHGTDGLVFTPAHSSDFIHCRTKR